MTLTSSRDVPVYNPRHGDDVSPSDIPWWGWFLCALGAGLVSFLIALFSSTREKKFYFSIVMYFIFGFTAAVCGIIGIIRFVKWVWGD
jgi:ABC-type branched-subunit amino acid transport system permease subunit